jgi:hypothetical protein
MKITIILLLICVLAPLKVMSNDRGITNLEESFPRFLNLKGSDLDGENDQTNEYSVTVKRILETGIVQTFQEVLRFTPQFLEATKANVKIKWTEYKFYLISVLLFGMETLFTQM